LDDSNRDCMNTINQEINTAFQATSLLLVFISVLFGLRYRQIKEDIAAPIHIPPEKLKDLHIRLWRSLLINCLPIVVISGFIVYLFLPLFIKVCSKSRFAPWSFDLARTSFVFVAVLVFLFFLWSVYLAVRLSGRIAKIRQDIAKESPTSANM